MAVGASYQELVIDERKYVLDTIAVQFRKMVVTYSVRIVSISEKSSRSAEPDTSVLIRANDSDVVWYFADMVESSVSVFRHARKTCHGQEGQYADQSSHLLRVRKESAICFMAVTKLMNSAL